MTKNVAQNVIDKCGGFERVARWCNITVKAVRGWTYEKDKNGNGTGGIIPAKHHRIIMKEAKLHGVPLDYSDFFSSDINLDSPSSADS